MILQFIALTALGLYVIASALFLCAIILRSPDFHSVASKSLGIGFLAHTIVLVMLLFDLTSDVSEMTIERGDYFFWLAFVLVLVYYVLGRRTNYSLIAVFVAAGAALFLAGSNLTSYLNIGLRGEEASVVFFTVHVVPALIGQVCLAFALFVSIAFLIVENRLRKKSFTAIAPRVPNLELLDNLNLRFSVSGFLTISIAILTGTIWKISHGLSLIPDDFAQWSAILCWILLAFLLQSKVNFEWSGRKTATTTVIGAGFFFVTLFVFVLNDKSVLHVLQ